MGIEPAKPLPALDFLEARLRLDAETGFLFWKDRDPSEFKSLPAYRSWRTQCLGKRADHRCQNGYSRVRFKIDGKWEIFGTHRIVWKMVNGFDPHPLIDHIDRNPLNNRPENLRVATHSENMTNRTAVEGRAAGKYIYPAKSGRYRAQFYRKGVCNYLGTFNSRQEAQAALRLALAKAA